MYQSLFLGLIVRLVLAPFLAHPYDMRIFMAVGWAVGNGMTPYGEYVLQNIFTGITHAHLFGFFYGIGYPPTWGLVLGSMYRFYSSLFPGNLMVYTFALKLPIILGDIVTSFALYRIMLRESDGDTASKLFNFYMLCPFMIVVGSVWGMFDVLVFLFAIASAYLLYKHLYWSALAIAISSSFKQYALILIPLYAIFLYKRSNSLKIGGRYLLVTSVILTILVLGPMLVFGWPLSNLYYALSSQMSPNDFYYQNSMDLTYGAASPFNIYNVFRLLFPGIAPPDFTNLFWIIGCSVFYLYALIKLSKFDFRSIVNYSFLVGVIFFSTRFWVSEQNLLFLLSFFALAVLLNRAEKSWILIHALWALLLAFVLVHVPASAFLWIVYPWTLNAATEFCNGALGYIRWVSMSVITFSWLGVVWWYSLREGVAWSE